MAAARIRSTPDQDLQYRCQTVRANGKTLVTPAKATDPAKTRPGELVNPKAEFVNEMHAVVSQASLDDALAGGGALERLLRSKRGRFQDPGGRVNMCFLEVRTDGIPSQKEIEFATGQAHAHSDITPLPMLSGFALRVTDAEGPQGRSARIPSGAKFARVVKYLRGSIMAAEQLGKKSVMGYVPDCRLYYEDLVKLYLDCGVNAFYFDAHLASPLALEASLRAFTGELDKNGMLEDSLVHMINPGRGMAEGDAAEIPARDVLGFGLGVDVLGERHMRRPPGPGMAEGARRDPGNRHGIFDKDSYGYLRAGDAVGVRACYPADSWVDMARIIAGGGRPDPRIQNAFNSVQLALEGARLRRRLARSEGVLEYVGGKRSVPEAYVKILKRAKVKG